MMQVAMHDIDAISKMHLKPAALAPRSTPKEATEDGDPPPEIESEAESPEGATEGRQEGQTCEECDHPQGSQGLEKPGRDGKGGSKGGKSTKEDCQIFIKTGKCRFGSKCKFNHNAEKRKKFEHDQQE